MTDPARHESEPELSGARHFTATGFVVWRGRVLLHWHRKQSSWLPFGGHVEENEDPVQCVLREVEEESGLRTEIYGSPAPYQFDDPAQLPPPVTILVEDVVDRGHRHTHIDLIYFCRPLAEPPALFADPTIRWLSAPELHANTPHPPGAGLEPVGVSDDVRLLALDALRRAEDQPSL